MAPRKEKQTPSTSRETRRTTQSRSQQTTQQPLPAAQEPQRQEQAPPLPTIEQMKGTSSSQRGKWDRLSTKYFEATRTPDRHSLRRLGIEDEVVEHLRRISWEDFVFTYEENYKDLIYEFLSSVELHKSKTSPKGKYSISFKLLTQNYTLSLQEVSNIFGFQNEGIDDLEDMDMTLHEFWSEVSIENHHDPNQAIAKRFKNLLYWTLHRIITFSIFAKGDGNEKVAQKDLLILYCMVKNKPLRSAKFFIDHLVHVSNSKKGTILVGSYITKIAKSVGALTERSKSILRRSLPPNDNLLDLKYFCDAKCIRCINENEDRWEYIHGYVGFQEEEQARERKKRKIGDPSQIVPPSSSSQPLPRGKGKEPSTSNMGGIEKMLAKVVRKMKFLSHIQKDIVEIQSKLDIPTCQHMYTTSEEEEDEAEEEALHVRTDVGVGLSSQAPYKRRKLMSNNKRNKSRTT